MRYNLSVLFCLIAETNYTTNAGLFEARRFVLDKNTKLPHLSATAPGNRLELLQYQNILNGYFAEPAIKL